MAFNSLVMRVQGSWIMAFLAAAVLLAAAPANAAEEPGRVGGRYLRWNEITTPVFNSETNSYFQVRADLSIKAPRSRWRNAHATAKRLKYLGLPGRLAVIPNRQVHDFLKKHFTLTRATWVGARFMCNGRKLLWVDGHVQRRGQFHRWHPKWNRTNIKCGSENISYMPIYYTRDKNRLRWQASGQEKAFKYYIVEYRVRKKAAPEKAAKSPKSAR